MALKIRLARGGAKKKPYYRMVVAEHTSPRDGKFVERIGSYNPMLPSDHRDRYVVNEDRLKHWLSVGAKPSDRVAKILGNLGLAEKPAYKQKPKSSAVEAEEKVAEEPKAKVETDIDSEPKVETVEAEANSADESKKAEKEQGS